jgi:hypothetical protein
MVDGQDVGVESITVNSVCPALTRVGVPQVEREIVRESTGHHQIVRFVASGDSLREIEKLQRDACRHRDSDNRHTDREPAIHGEELSHGPSVFTGAPPIVRL